MIDLLRRLPGNHNMQTSVACHQPLALDKK